MAEIGEITNGNTVLLFHAGNHRIGQHHGIALVASVADHSSHRVPPEAASSLSRSQLYNNMQSPAGLVGAKTKTVMLNSRDAAKAFPTRSHTTPRHTPSRETTLIPSTIHVCTSRLGAYRVITSERSRLYTLFSAHQPAVDDGTCRRCLVTRSRPCYRIRK